MNHSLEISRNFINYVLGRNPLENEKFRNVKCQSDLQVTRGGSEFPGGQSLAFNAVTINRFFPFSFPLKIRFIVPDWIVLS